jgi:hypothetical protein
MNRKSGLLNGLFSNQKYQFELILEGLRLENVDIFYCHLEYFTFGIFYDHSVNFVFIWNIIYGFGMMNQEKSDNPACGTCGNEHLF